MPSLPDLDHARPAEVGQGALAITLGPVADDPSAAPLDPVTRDEILSWREQLWTELEQRVGPLAARDPAEWYELMVFERWGAVVARSGVPPLALGAYYKVRGGIPRQLQLKMRRTLIRRQGSPVFPAWPFERAGRDLVELALADHMLVRGVTAVGFPWFWPERFTAAATLTHDVESADGLRRAGEVGRWEEEHGFRSSFNVVSNSYPIDPKCLAELKARGHEIGSHAIHHDRSLFASRAAFERQLPLLRDAAQRLDATGFRSPATHRVVEWMSELPFSYDCTMSHSDPYEPIPGGTATVWPFFHGDVVELPYTAPQDHALFNLLGHRDSSVWRGQLEQVAAVNGLFQLVTHPDPEYLGRPAAANAYREMLAAIGQREDLWVALPRDVAAWWRRRASGLQSPSTGTARWTGSGVALEPGPAPSRGRSSRLLPRSRARRERRSADVVMVLEHTTYSQDVRSRSEAAGLRETGRTVEVLAPHEPGQPSRETIRGVRVTRFPRPDGNGRLFGTAIEYLFAVCTVTPAVLWRIARSPEGTLHVHNPPDVFFPLLMIARWRGWNTVFDMRDDAAGLLRAKLGRPSRMEAVLAWMRSRSASVSDLTITTNHTQRELVEAVARKVVIVRYSAPTWFAEHRPSPPCGRARVVFLGAMGVQDRVTRAVEVLAALVNDRGLDVELLLIGDGPERGAVEALARELGVDDRLCMTGWVEHERVPVLLASAHVGLDAAPFTEVNHGSSMVKIFEYLAVGLPVVASALHETEVTAGDAIVMVREDSVAAYADPVADLLASPLAWQEAAARARSRGTRHQWPAEVRKLIEAYPARD